jgi:hypothetical protein
MGGISKMNFHVFRELCGDEALKNVVIVTNMWETVEQDQGKRRERQLAKDPQLFGSAIREGATMHRHLKTSESAKNILRHIITNYPLPLRIQVEFVDQHLKLAETAAGKVLYQDQV